ncbi:helix-turn-helix domain-containing protein [Paenibacillus daejeonensis]|uniref:helix-turn-helix domain-containing protein n=1 Tax=Paenibacillus daejeonensis TaxID=135193 RepID=UPI0003A7C721|nr:helix-turn-helix transcriptional regulator [Paenibacillus daejeonensis]
MLLENDMNRTQLREELGLSSATLAKLGKDEYVSMETIDKICSRFSCQPNDIMTHIPEQAE